MRPSKIPILAVILALPAGCAYLPPDFNREPPAAFHDTRMLSAMVAGEEAALGREFGMKAPLSWEERVAAGVMLPFTAATETAFFPVFAGLKTLEPKRAP